MRVSEVRYTRSQKTAWIAFKSTSYVEVRTKNVKGIQKWRRDIEKESENKIFAMYTSWRIFSLGIEKECSILGNFVLYVHV